GNNELASNVLCRYGTHPIRCSIHNSYYVRQAGVPETFYVGRQGEVMGDSNGEDNISNMTQGAFEVSKAQLASGEVCFALNNNQQEIAFYQTIGTDEVPTILSNGHKRVYAKGQVKCNGVKYGEASYSNVAPNNIDQHQFVDGVCTVCGASESEAELPQDEDGYYAVATAIQFKQFCDLVNDKNMSDANVRLYDDIDLTDEKYAKTRLSTFGGEFDGQGHVITTAWNLPGAAGLVAALKGEVHDVILRGTMINSQSYMGAIAGTTLSARIRNCVVETEITSTYNGHNGSVEGGGIVGRNEGNNTWIENVVFAGKLIQGEDESANLNAVGGIQGNNRGSTTIRNCIVTGSVEARSTDAATFAHDGQATTTNCYYLNDFPGGTYGDCTKVTEEELYSGALIYKLNGGNIDPKPAAEGGVVWRQNTYKDAPSTPMSTGGDAYGIVYSVKDNKCMGVYDAESLSEFQTVFNEVESTFASYAEANAEVIEDYMPQIEKLTAITDYKEFWYAYVDFLQKKQLLLDNINAYATLFDRAESARTYLKENELLGEAAELLNVYVNDVVDPGEQFTNGSVLYIKENYQLGTEDVRNEITYLNSLFGKAIGNGYQPGADISLLLVNADFSNGTNGWNGRKATGAANIQGAMPILETWRNTSDMHQTITGLKEGVYELEVNAFTRTAGNDLARFYTAYIYANDIIVPVMNLQEDLLPFNEAVDQGNCYIANAGTYPYDCIFNEFYYYPNSYTGAAYAFKGHRFTNHVTVNVTDGTLKVGISQEGSGLDNDWLVFGNVVLRYCGEMAASNDALDATLSDDVARATTILEAEVSGSMGDNCTPNFYGGYRTALQEAIDAADVATTEAEKYAVIQNFSTIFPQVKACQLAYISVLNKIDAHTDDMTKKHDDGKLTDAEYEAAIAEVGAAENAYWDGTYTTEEAKNLKWTITAIENIEAATEKAPVIFNMLGQKVQNVEKGRIYIINGKKVLVK
ncbi:MAG: hypothetical protein IKN86_04595, partial [Bacteroidaceae bacterium]|nr:hypothetical protein [Bacteroidaceae bacterium]